jgi:serine/threonine protein kinase
MPREMATPATSSSSTTLDPIAVKQFGKYFLVRKIAEGGMAEIFLAKQVGAEGFERNVVIKRMLQHLSAVPDFVGMFLDEARLAARLAHPNIIQINDLGLADGCYYICMEYLSGEDFSTVLRTAARRREYVPLHVVLKVMADAAHGLHFAHEFTDEQGKPLNIVHRDISPSNLYLTYQGQVKVLDFGIARAESRVTNTTAGVVKGKYMYMSPEQASGKVVDRRADVFSLGVSLYEALTNVRPFARDNDLAILNAVLNNDLQPPSSLRPDLPPELDAIVLKAMNTDLRQRYASAAELATAIERYLATLTSVGGSAPSAAFMRELFGEARYQNKMKIPSLASLAANGVDVPGFSNPFLPKTELADGATLGTEAATRSMSGPSVPVVSTPRGPLRWVLVAGLALVAAVGGGWAANNYLRVETKGVTPAPPPPAPVAALAPVPAERVPPPPVEPPRTEVVAPTVEEPVKPTRPVKLTAQLIEGVVRARYGAFTRCFQDNKADLPGAEGQLQLTFTIAGSGKVTQAKSDLSGKPVSRCIESQVQNLRFPVNKDKEVTLTLPLRYQVK